MMASRLMSSRDLKAVEGSVLPDRDRPGMDAPAQQAQEQQPFDNEYQSNAEGRV
jgi:hypothetical protein